MQQIPQIGLAPRRGMAIGPYAAWQLCRADRRLRPDETTRDVARPVHGDRLGGSAMGSRRRQGDNQAARSRKYKNSLFGVFVILLYIFPESSFRLPWVDRLCPWMLAISEVALRSHRRGVLCIEDVACASRSCRGSCHAPPVPITGNSRLLTVRPSMR